MKDLLKLPWAVALSAIAAQQQQHLAAAFPATPPATNSIVQPGSGSGSGSVAMTNDTSLNATDAFSSLATVSAGFPPGPTPNNDVIFYRVPNSNPPVTVKFVNMHFDRPWVVQPGRDEGALRTLLQELVDEYSNPAEMGKAMEVRSYEWDEGSAPKPYVYMEPEEPMRSLYPPYQRLELTEGIWADTVRGFQDFLTAYPKLAFRYESYLLYRPHDEYAAAHGHVSMDAVEKVQTT